MQRKKSDPNKGGPLQLGFFTPESDWRPTPVSSLPSWDRARRISLDSETKDTSLRTLGPGVRRGGYTTGWGFAIEGGPAHYLPIRHEGGDNLPEEEVLRYLRENLKDFQGDIVGAHLAYDLDYAAEEGIVFHPEARFRDVQIADPLIDELQNSYSLENIGERWGIQSKSKQLLIDAAKSMGLNPGAGMWRLPARFVGEYAERDVTSPLEIYAKQREVLTRDNLWRVFDLETDVLPVLVKMRRRGVRIDFEKLRQIELWSIAQEREALEIVRRETGYSIGESGIWKPDAIAPALREIGVTLSLTSTGKPRIDAELLERIDHPVATAIRHARKVNKIRTTFANSIHKYQINGRIHCTFNQIVREDEELDGRKSGQKGVRFGRLSSADPNLQQQPSPDRDPVIAGEWRKIFLPEEGAIWGCLDYKQQEPRWTTHFAAIMDLPKAKEAARRYREDPRTDNHEMMTRLVYRDDQVNSWIAENSPEFKVARNRSKIIYLGLVYGQGGPELCRDLGLPTRWALIRGWGTNRSTEYFESRHDAWNARAQSEGGFVKEVAGEEGQAILNKFDEEAPFVRQVAQKASQQAEARGFVKTVMGRRLHFERRLDGTYDWTHKALNRVIQGTGADQAKKSLVDLDREGFFLQLAVHDENDASFSTVAEALRAGEIQAASMDEFNPEVPFAVDVEFGPSWGELRKVN